MGPTISSQLASPLATVLRRFRRGQTCWDALRIASLGCALLVAEVLAGCLLDRFFDIAGLWRAPLPWLALAIFLGFSCWTIYRLIRQADFDSVALALDQAAGDARGHLRNLLHLSPRGDVSPFFLDASQQSAMRFWEQRRPGKYLRCSAAIRMALCALALLLALLVLALLPHARADLLLARFLDPLGNHPRPTASWLDVSPTPPQVLRSGDDLTIQARLRGKPVNNPAPLIHIVYADDSTLSRALQLGEDGTWKIELGNLKQSFTWRLAMDRARSRDFGLQILPRPTIVDTQVTYDFPAYSRLPSKTEKLEGRTIVALDGTRITLKLRSNVPLAQAQGRSEDESLRFQIDRDDPAQASRFLTVSREMKVAIELLSQDQVPSKQELPFTVRPVADKPPSLSVLSELDGQSYFLTDTIEISWRAQDDLGLSAVYVKAEPEAGNRRAEPTLVELDLPQYGAKNAAGTAHIPIADLYQGPAPFLKLSLLARDTKDQEGQSRVLRLQLATDSLDRQLRQLLLTYEGINSRDADKRGISARTLHENRSKAIKALRNRVMIVADGLDDGAALGEAQTTLVRQLRDQARAVHAPALGGSTWSYDFQYAALLPRFRSYGEYAATWAFLAVPDAALSAPLEAALAAANPKAQLTALLPTLDQQAQRQEQITQRVGGDYRIIVRELVGYLAATSAAQLGAGDGPHWQDSNFLVQHRAVVQEVRERSAATLADEVAAADLEALSQALAQEDVVAGLRAAQPVLARVAQTLAAQAAAAVRQRAADSAVLPPALLEQSGQRDVEQQLALGLQLAANQFGGDELLRFDAAMAYLATQAASAARPQLGASEHAAAFRLFTAMGNFRAALQDLRLGAASGQLTPGLPETLTNWLAVREARLALIDLLARPQAPPPALRPLLEQLLSESAAFQAWQPAPLTPPLLEALRGWELRCGECLTQLQSQVNLLLAQAQQASSAAAPLFTQAIAAYRQGIAAEIARLEREHNIQAWHFTGMTQLKLRLAALTVAALTHLDMVDLAHVHQVSSALPLPPYVALFAGASEAQGFFERKVEGTTWTLALRDSEAGWKGQASTYLTLDAKMAALLPLVPTPAQWPQEQALELALDNLDAAQSWRSELDAAGRQHQALRRISDPRQYVTTLLDKTDQAPSAWAELHYRLFQLEALLSGAEALPAKSPAVQQALAWTERFDHPPREMRELADLFRASLSGGEARPRGELATQATSLLGQLRPLVQRTSRVRIPLTHTPDVMNQNLDMSAVARAKWRSQRQLIGDEQHLERILASLALEEQAFGPADLAWAVAAGELNRRRAGLTMAHAGLGGIALSGESSTAINLPKHIYLELKRAREKAMPPLFREQCHQFLNQVLEKASQ